MEASLPFTIPTIPAAPFSAILASPLEMPSASIVCACASLIPITLVRANAAKKAAAHVRARFPFPCLFAISETTV